MNKTIVKSIWSVLAGFLVVVVFSTLTDTILEWLQVFPAIGGARLDTWMLALAFVYRSVYTVFGGYVTARLAPDQPMKHVMVLAVIGTMAGIAGVFAGWNLSDHWYPIALAVTAFPLVWCGGRLKK